MRCGLAFKIISLLWFCFAGLAFAAEPLQIKDAWSPEAPPVVPVMAGYMQIYNPGDKPVTIDAISSPQFGLVQIHKTVTENNLSRMIHQPSLVIPPKQTVALQRGGLHIMLMQKKSTLKRGDHIALTLTLDNKQQLTVDLQVREAQLDDHSHHHHH